MSENCSVLTETVVIAFKVENSLKTNQTVKFIRVLPGSNSRACFHMIWKQLVNIIVVYRYNLTDSHLKYRVTTASCLKTGPAAILETTCSQNSRISNATTLPFTKTCVSTKLNWTYLPTYLPELLMRSSHSLGWWQHPVFPKHSISILYHFRHLLV